MKVTIVSESNIPEDAQCPLSDDFLNQSFQTILPEDSLQVTNEWFENTSDVLIVSSSFGTVDKIHNWTLRQIAVDSSRVARIRELLVPDGFSELIKWFSKSGALLNADPTLWICYSMTVRFENDRLIFDEHIASRPHARPEPGWPTEPYRPSSKDKKY